MLEAMHTAMLRQLCHCSIHCTRHTLHLRLDSICELKACQLANFCISSLKSPWEVTRLPQGTKHSSTDNTMRHQVLIRRMSLVHVGQDKFLSQFPSIEVSLQTLTASATLHFLGFDLSASLPTIFAQCTTCGGLPQINCAYVASHMCHASSNSISPSAGCSLLLGDWS